MRLENTADDFEIDIWYPKKGYSLYRLQEITGKSKILELGWLISKEYSVLL